MRERYARIPLEPWLPVSDAMLRGEALFFESRADFRSRYGLAEQQLTTSAPLAELSCACLPLVAHGRAVGGVSLVFPRARTFAAEEREADRGRRARRSWRSPATRATANRRRALESGFSEHFAKPLPIARLLGFIDSLPGT